MARPHPLIQPAAQSLQPDCATAATPRAALVVEGGAMRSVFSAGLLAGFQRAQFNPFDLYIGVSGGACNLVGYLSGEADKSLDIYQAVAAHARFISYRRFLAGGDLIDIHWLVEFLFHNHGAALLHLPLEQRPLLITATDVATGTASFIRATSDNLAAALTASMSLPLMHRRFPAVDGRPQTDGGVAANIPVAEAIARGATRIMVIRSRPRSYCKRDTLYHRFIRFKLRRHRALVATMEQRVSLHRRALELLQLPPPGVTIVDICPPDSFSGGRFSRRAGLLRAGFDVGVDAAADAMRQWQTAMRDTDGANC